ncbi:MAG TPA: preprotein translocase subunit SecY, partial [Candidatus Scybalomonas excrementigallinarum]|nr:preprotein translocase subunit SecY [Candidatus Scybalomonas excrementigallinarum]
MFKTLHNALKMKDIRKKLLFTLGMLLVVRIGSQLPLPGIDNAAVKAFLQSSLGDSFNLINSFTGGSFLDMSIFALNVTPYITSSIIIQLLTIAIPALEELQKDGESGRKKMTEITRYVTIALGIIESLGLAITFQRQGLFRDMNEYLIIVSMVVTLTTGAALVMWIGERITEKGVGNGISIIL